MSWFLGYTRLTILRRGQVDTDAMGSPIYANTETPIKGELIPMQGDEFSAAQAQVITRFRVLLPASYGGLGLPLASDAIKDPEGFKYEMKGKPEAHRLNGRLHHWEVVVERVTG